MPDEIKNNLDLYRFLLTLPSDQHRQEVYDSLRKELPFKVKSLGFLMKKGAQVDSRPKATIDA